MLLSIRQDHSCSLTPTSGKKELVSTCQACITTYSQTIQKTMRFCGLYFRDIDANNLLTFTLREFVKNAFDASMERAIFLTFCIKKTNKTFIVKIKDKGIGFPNVAVGSKIPLTADNPLFSKPSEKKRGSTLGGYGIGLLIIVTESAPYGITIMIKRRKERGTSAECHIPLFVKSHQKPFFLHLRQAAPQSRRSRIHDAIKRLRAKL